MPIEIIPALSSLAIDAVDIGTGGVDRLARMPRGAQKISATFCGLGALYFTTRVLYEAFYAAEEARRTKDVPSKHVWPIVDDVVGLIVSTAGFAGILRLANRLEKEAVRSLR
jgi:hypothetical protein